MPPGCMHIMLTSHSLFVNGGTRQGFNRYYPPDFDPTKHVTLNTYHGKHALGDRARKIDKGILITRFELPFNIWWYAYVRPVDNNAPH